MVTKGVTLWIFNPSPRKSNCLTCTGIYFHPIFYRSFPQSFQILLHLFYVDFIYDIPINYTVVRSSAKSLIHHSMYLQIPFTYTRNSSGPKTLPCGTLEVTLTSLDSCPPYLTLCVRQTRNSLRCVHTNRVESNRVKSSPVRL